MTYQLLLAGSVTLLVIPLLLTILLMIRVTRAMMHRSEKPRCISCGSPDVRLSFKSGLLDNFFELFSCSPFRCRACSARFYRYRRVQPEDVTTR